MPFNSSCPSSHAPNMTQTNLQEFPLIHLNGAPCFTSKGTPGYTDIPDPPSSFCQSHRLQDQLYYYPIGTPIQKQFSHHLYNCHISQYHPRKKLYSISYNIGNSEEITHSEVTKYKPSAQPSLILQATFPRVSSCSNELFHSYRISFPIKIYPCHVCEGGITSVSWSWVLVGAASVGWVKGSTIVQIVILARSPGCHGLTLGVAVIVGEWGHDPVPCGPISCIEILRN